MFSAEEAENTEPLRLAAQRGASTDGWRVQDTIARIKAGLVAATGHLDSARRVPYFL